MCYWTFHASVICCSAWREVRRARPRRICHTPGQLGATPPARHVVLSSASAWRSVRRRGCDVTASSRVWSGRGSAFRTVTRLINKEQPVWGRVIFGPGEVQERSTYQVMTDATASSLVSFFRFAGIVFVEAAADRFSLSDWVIVWEIFDLF